MPKSSSLTKIVFGLASTGVVATAAYLRVIRPWHLRWGATDQEVRRPMPGDDIVPQANLIATRAITINTSASHVWPWLAQMGYRRAGWYSYDHFDNDGIHVYRIIPELQNLKVGDMLLTGPDVGFRVEAIEPDRSLVLAIHGASMGLDEDISSVSMLDPIDDSHTRLIMRLRAEFRGVRERLWGWLLFDFGDFVMMRKMMLGIKQRAESFGEVEHPS